MENSNLINTINAVEGFDPTPYAVDYTDLNTGETRKRLPVMAQTAAVGIALRNAGFGLQFAMAGDEFPEVAVEGAPINAVPDTAPEELYTVEESAPPEPTQEEKLQQAMKVPCPISKFKGKTLGEVLQLDPGAVKWLAEKFTGSEEIKTAAQFIRDCALSQAIA